MTGIARDAATAVGPGDRPPPRRIVLLDWQPIGKGALVGKAAIRLPNGLEIADIGVFARCSQRWAQLPAEQMRDAGGQPLRDANGRVRWRSSLRWETRQLQDKFSHALIELLLAEHPNALDGGAT